MMAERIKTTPISLQKIHFISRDTQKFKVKLWKKLFHANGNEKEDGVSVVISDKTDFKSKTVKKTRALHNDKGINPKRKYNI